MKGWFKWVGVGVGWCDVKVSGSWDHSWPQANHFGSTLISSVCQIVDQDFCIFPITDEAVIT